MYMKNLYKPTISDSKNDIYVYMRLTWLNGFFLKRWKMIKTQSDEEIFVNNFRCFRIGAKIVPRKT